MSAPGALLPWRTPVEGAFHVEGGRVGVAIALAALGPVAVLGGGDALALSLLLGLA